MNENANRSCPNAGPEFEVPTSGACSCECQALMKRLSAAEFAAFELHLLLDTHPNDPGILAEYQKYERMAQVLREDYQQERRPAPSFGSIRGRTLGTGSTHPGRGKFVRRFDQSVQL